MKPSKNIVSVLTLLALAAASPVLQAAPEPGLDSSIAACLQIWRDHPFGKNPQFKTLGTSVKVAGIGSMVGDRESTSAPALYLVSPTINALGGSTIELLNPNGWYCMKTMVSFMGSLNIRAHCKAQLAETSAGSTVIGNNVDNQEIKNKGVTMFGHVTVERPCG